MSSGGRPFIVLINRGREVLRVVMMTRRGPYFRNETEQPFPLESKSLAGGSEGRRKRKVRGGRGDRYDVRSSGELRHYKKVKMRERLLFNTQARLGRGRRGTANEEARSITRGKK